MNFYIYQSDITVDLQTNEVEIHRKQTEDWKVSIVDTGLQSSVMERLIMVRELAGDEPVLVAYGDCLSDIDIQEMIESHRRQQSLATVQLHIRPVEMRSLRSMSRAVILAQSRGKRRNIPG